MTEAKASPKKNFFIDEITRDISLYDCILDLLDNSIDSANKIVTPNSSTKTKFSGYEVNISFDENNFIISDNCGGISKQDAIEYAFNFGRDLATEENESEAMSIGFYGIGMKRAIFKIGKKTKVESQNNLDNFIVSIDVDAWRADNSPDWSFPLKDTSLSFNNGTKIIISDLNYMAAEQFANPAFENRIISTIARDYHFFLKDGIVIKVNGKTVLPHEFSLRQGDELKPINFSYVDEISGVKVTITAGMAAPPPDDYADSELRIKDADLYGWYVICNDRVVLAANRDERTVWKGKPHFTAWHPQYNGFMGFIFFETHKPGDLPWTTTKRDIDQSSPLYKRAIPHMEKVTQKWVEYTNSRKIDLVAASQVEKQSRAITISNVQANTQNELSFPKITSNPSLPSVKMTTISYQVPLDEKQKVAKSLGNTNMSNRDVGSKTFYYYFENEVE